MKHSTLIFAVLALVAAAPLAASGFGVYEHGMQGKGSVGAFTARAEDGSALFYNPAGLAKLKFSEIAFGGTGNFIKSYYSNAGQSTWSSKAESTVLPDFFANFKWGRFGVGIGTARTYDYKVGWPDDDFPARFLGTDSEFTVQEHMTGVGYRVSDHFSVGFTARLANLEHNWSRVLPRPLDPTNPALHYEVADQVEVDGDATGFSVGLQYYRSRRFSVGMTYYSPIEIDVDGTRTFSLATRTDDQRAIDAFNNSFANTPLTSVIELPERLQVGVASRVTVRTRMEIDITQDNWSDSWAQNTYISGDGANPLVINRNWDDVTTLRIAGDFQQRKSLAWRLGLASTFGAAVPDETVEPGFADNDRFIYSAGVTYISRQKYIFEAAWVYVQNRDRSVGNQELSFNGQGPDFYQSNGQEGLYETQRHQLSLGMRIRLGVKAVKDRKRLR